MTLLLLSLAGGLGALARFVLDAAVNRRTHRTLPLGTLVINVSGSFLLGLLAGWAAGAAAGLAPAVKTVVGTGFCGGYTTFSTASVETARLFAADGPTLAGGYAALTLVGSTAAAALGLWLGGAFA